MRRAARKDTNQTEIVEALRWAGASVTLTHRLGQGFPDAVAGIDGHNLLLEIKHGNENLTPDEAEWHAAWRGQVAIVRSPEEAVALVERWRRGDFRR